MSEEEKLLWDAIVREPGEDTPKLALADWYLEHNSPSLAHALKWCVGRNKWPRTTPKRKEAVWNGLYQYRADSKKLSKSTLPSIVSAQFNRTAHFGERRFKSTYDAIVHLAVALDKLRRAYDVIG